MTPSQKAITAAELEISRNERRIADPWRKHLPVGEAVQSAIDEATSELRAENESFHAALKTIERHHVEQNRLKNRPEDRSLTLNIIRAALALKKG